MTKSFFQTQLGKCLGTDYRFAEVGQLLKRHLVQSLVEGRRYGAETSFQLIAQNGRMQVAQTAQADKPAAEMPIDVVVAGAGAAPTDTPQATPEIRDNVISVTPATTSPTPPTPFRVAAASAKTVTERARPTRRIAAAANADAHEPRARRPEHSSPRHRALIWPGDSTPEGPRRPTWLQRLSSTDR